MAEKVSQPGRVRNAKLRYQQRIAAARTTRDVLAAAVDYFRGSFTQLSKAEAEQVSDRLIEMTDDERRRVTGA